MSRNVRLAGGDYDDAIPDGLTAEIGDRVLGAHRPNNGALPVPWVLLEDMLPRSCARPALPAL